MKKIKKKTLFTIFCIISVILALIVVFPFSQPGNKIKTGEAIFKFLFIPVLIFLISFMFFYHRRLEMKQKKNISLGVLKMIFMPICMYLTGLIAWVMGILYYQAFTEDLIPITTTTKAGLAYTIVFITIMFILDVYFAVYSKWSEKLTPKQFDMLCYIFYGASLFVFLLNIIAYAKAPNHLATTPEKALLAGVVCAIFFFTFSICALIAEYSGRYVPLILNEQEYLSSIEKEKLISSDVEREIKQEFKEYYEKDKGFFIQPVGYIKKGDEE